MCVYELANLRAAALDTAQPCAHAELIATLVIHPVLSLVKGEEKQRSAHADAPFQTVSCHLKGELILMNIHCHLAIKCI